MKTIILCHILILVAGFNRCDQADAASDFENDLMLREECVKDGSLSDEEAKRVVSGEMFSSKYSETSDKIKCVVQCLTQKLGAIDSDGKLNTDVFADYIEFKLHGKKEQIRSALSKCTSVKSTQPCDVAYDSFVCVLKNLNIYSLTNP